MLSLESITEALSQYPLFSHITLHIESLSKSDKKEFWGTSVKRFITDGFDRFSEEGFIYVNLKDIDSDEKLLEVITHEASHLLDDSPELKGEILEYLKDALKVKGIEGGR